jgi:hypothetical protein
VLKTAWRATHQTATIMRELMRERTRAEAQLADE